ncbi:hypothetical protein GPJ56_004448 [Histomonas meleagridis]|uniref:uncharacterized protein n=1 Tax=Histomonas meleagridis TaxID=135588 RepID=UPI003559D4D6|nr:hypothetical protein GPJ56_004448 [Histomonas meleagridis]KAH0802024.1 hypothetical protein GO595_005105 [Histomonas meleagridis]
MFCIAPDSLRQSCPTGYINITSVTEINETNSSVLNLYIINDGNNPLELNFNNFSVTTFEINGQPNSVVSLSNIKENNILSIANISVITQSDKFDPIFLKLRHVNFLSSNVILNTINLDTDFYSLTNFTQITADEGTFTLEEESYYPTKDISIRFAKSWSGYKVIGAASDANICFGIETDVMIFMNIPYKVTIYKQQIRYTLQVELVNPSGNITFTDDSYKWLNYIPTLQIYIYTGCYFAIPIYSVPLEKHCFFIYVYGESTIELNENSKLSHIFLSESTLHFLLNPGTQSIYSFASVGDNIIDVNAKNKTSNSTQLIFDQIEFSEYSKSLFHSNDRIKVQFNYIVFNSGVNSSQLDFTGDSSYVILNDIDLLSGTINFSNLEFGSLCQLNFKFSLSMMGTINIDNVIIKYRTTIDVVIDYCVTYIPKDEEVTPLFTTPHKIVNLNGYYANMTKIHYPQFANVYGFCDDTSLTDVKFNEDTGDLTLSMTNYPSIIDSYLCYGEVCNDKTYYQITKDNFSQYKTRIEDFTVGITIIINESMPPDIYFDFSDISASLTVICLDSDYSFNVYIGNNSLAFITFSNGTINFIDKGEVLQPYIMLFILLYGASINTTSIDNIYFCNSNCIIDIDSLQTFELRKFPFPKFDSVHVTITQNTTIEFKENGYNLTSNYGSFEIDSDYTFSIETPNIEIHCNGNIYNSTNLLYSSITLAEYRTLNITGDWSKGVEPAIRIEPDQFNVETLNIITDSEIIPLELNVINMK